MTFLIPLLLLLFCGDDEERAFSNFVGFRIHLLFVSLPPIITQQSFTDTIYPFSFFRDDDENDENIQVLDYHQVDANRGLSEKTNAIDKLRLRFGANEMPEEKGQNFIKLILKQFDDLLVKILIVAAIVSFILAAVDGDGELAFVEPTVIVLILIANATVGVVTETNAEKADAAGKQALEAELGARKDAEAMLATEEETAAPQRRGRDTQGRHRRTSTRICAEVADGKG